jgi:hypothetical protein
LTLTITPDRYPREVVAAHVRRLESPAPCRPHGTHGRRGLWHVPTWLSAVGYDARLLGGGAAVELQSLQPMSGRCVAATRWLERKLPACSQFCRPRPMDRDPALRRACPMSGFAAKYR